MEEISESPAAEIRRASPKVMWNPLLFKLSAPHLSAAKLLIDRLNEMTRNAKAINDVKTTANFEIVLRPQILNNAHVPATKHATQAKMLKAKAAEYLSYLFGQLPKAV
eukprot:GDKJ01006340.1.p2 GENE.GDKJ01006340.1~~GDKJ01006340.1.p2  ORF type:complete len:108 (-),score=2.62 GDKJ01006340.1:29-352(-)